ncbi:hypothetical protein [Kaistella haifensis]|nr:hypothetical protein [Kaistella haifensis]
MTTINGLSDQFGKYVLVSTFNSHLNDENAHSTYLAKRDASNLTPTNVNDWKAKLGVGDLPENIATYDYDIHNQVMMKDGTTKEATDLGKNIANSSLTSVAGAGLTLGSSWTLNTNGQLYSVTNLPDKSADTSFNKMLIQNSTGQVAWGNGRTLIKNMPALLSDAEKTNWKTEMNGGWTTNTMSVAVIMPPIVDKQDKNYWITLRGTGLNFNPTNFSIDIMNEAGTTVIDNIPNSQVQLYTDGLVLVFYYNFKNFPLGNYRIRLRNGVVEYITGTTGIISVVNSITSTILTGNWESKFYNDVAYTGTYGSGNSANYQSSEVIKSGYAPYATDNSIVQALLSPQFVGANQDFYLEFNTQWNNVHPYPHFAGVWVGISLASSVIQLSNQNIAYIYGYGTDIRYLLNDTSGVNVAGQVLKEISVKTIMVRRGNQLTILTIRDNSVSTVMTKTISTEALKIGITGKNFQKGKEESVNFIISQLFLF